MKVVTVLGVIENDNLRGARVADWLVAAGPREIGI